MDDRGQAAGVCLLILAIVGVLLAFLVEPGQDAVRLLLPAGAGFDPGRMIAESILRLGLGFLANLWWLFMIIGLLLIAVESRRGGGGY